MMSKSLYTMGPLVTAQSAPVLAVITVPSVSETLSCARSAMQAPPGLPNCSRCAVDCEGRDRGGRPRREGHQRKLLEGVALVSWGENRPKTNKKGSKSWAR